MKSTEHLYHTRLFFLLVDIKLFMEVLRSLQ